MQNAKNEIERPQEIPPATWSKAVALARELAEDPTVRFFWPVWTRVYKRFLRRVESGARSDCFYALFDEYKAAGGRGSTYDADPGPDAGSGPGMGQEGHPPRPGLGVCPRLLSTRSGKSGILSGMDVVRDRR